VLSPFRERAADERVFKLIIGAEVAVHIAGEGLYIMRLPKLRPIKNSSGVVAILTPESLVADGSRYSLLCSEVPFLSFGLTRGRRPVDIGDIALPRTGHKPIGSPLVFDVFLPGEEIVCVRLPKGFIVNRYQLDINIPAAHRDYQPRDVECSLQVLETFALRNQPTVEYQSYRYSRMAFMEQADPLGCIGFLNIIRREPQSSTESASEPRSVMGREAYSLISDAGASEREAALASSGSQNIDRPTTAHAKHLKLFDRRFRREDRTLCEMTGRAVGVTKVGEGFNHMGQPQDRCTYHVYDYAYR